MYYYLCWPQNNYFMFVRNNWKGQIYGSNTILHYYMYFFHKKEKYSFLTNKEWIHLLVWDLLLCLYENTHKPLLPSLSAEDPLKHCFVCNSTKVLCFLALFSLLVALLPGQPANLALQPVMMLCIFPYNFFPICWGWGGGLAKGVIPLQFLLLLKAVQRAMITSQALMFPTTSLFSDSWLNRSASTFSAI